MNLSNLKIGTRMYLGYGAVVLILVILVTVAYNNFARLGRANDINVHTYQVMAQVKGALESLINTETGQRGFVLTGNPASLEPYNNGKASFSAYLKAAADLTADNPQQQERLAQLGREQQAWLKDAVDPVVEMRREVGEGDIAPVIALVKEGKTKRGMDAMRAQIDAIISAESGLLSQRSKEAAALKQETSTMLVAGGVLAALLAAVIAFWQTRNITGPLRRAVDLAQRVAEGDLRHTVVIDAHDETGELLTALDSMNTSLGRIVAEVRGGTDTIATASSQIMSGNMDLSARTEQQASSLEETASSMEELTSTVKQNAENARQANQLANSASEVAVRGGAAVTEVVHTMGAINDSARKIVDIIGVIDGIAFQTNILALNAAVEAARAGEQGRGFAVVASEVRSLAQRSASAAKEIKTLIDDSVDKVELGSRLVNQAGVTMEEVVSSVRRVTDIISEIASASEEQQAGIEQVNQAINQMDEVTQQNAALVEEAAAASSSMQDQAAALAQVVSVFQINAAQQAPRPSPAAAPAQQPPQASARPASRPVANLPKPKAPAKVAASDDWEEF